MTSWNVIEMKKTIIYKLLLVIDSSKEIALRQSNQYMSLVFIVFIVHNVIILHNVHTTIVAQA
jgi:hypothetical protein